MSYREWAGRKQRVRAFSEGDRTATHAEGVVISYTDRPTVGIRMDNGQVFDWVADLCESIAEPCRETEGNLGVTCELPTGHGGWHNGRHRPRPDPNPSGDYAMQAQWPRDPSDVNFPEVSDA